MNSKWFYLIIGVLLGVIVAIVLVAVPGRTASAFNPAILDGGATEGIIALTASAPRTNLPILWVLDVKKKNLLLYEYADENRIKLKTLRDIQFDLDVPKYYLLPARPGRELTPMRVEEEFEKWRKELEKREAEMKKRMK